MYRNQINRLRKTFSEAYDNDDVIKAILTGERILKLYNTNKGSDTLFFSDDAYNLACAYSKEGRFSKAAALFKKSADIVEKIHGKNLDYSRIITNLAVELFIMPRTMRTLLNTIKKLFLLECVKTLIILIILI